MISLFGFMCNLVPHVLIGLLYGPDFSGPMESWFYIVLGLAYFVYLVADNSDGKQARRTGTSSPLGMLLDHGMDSVTAVIENFVIQRVLQIGNGYMNMIALLISTMPFYFAQLEQYYTGELILQEINGVDDGSWLLIGICFAPAFLGYDCFLQNVSILWLPPMQIKHLIIYGLLVSQIYPTFD